jgi:hypothetical protein
VIDPAAPAEEVPVVCTKDPVLEVLLIVEKEMEPLEIPPSPLVTCMSPPDAAELAAEPEKRKTLPPLPLKLSPTDKTILPEVPPARLDPVESVKLPVDPEVEFPVPKSNEPLMGEAPVLRYKEPLDVEPEPVETKVAPPEAPVELPEVIEVDPPAPAPLDPAPKDRDAPVDEPPLAPADKVIDPAAPAEEAPVERVIPPLPLEETADESTNAPLVVVPEPLETVTKPP